MTVRYVKLSCHIERISSPMPKKSTRLASMCFRDNIRTIFHNYARLFMQRWCIIVEIICITRVWRLFSRATSGPPESPWQESFPEPPAQIMMEVEPGPARLLHSALVVTVTSTSCREVDDFPLPSPNLPQPVTVARWPSYVDSTSAGRHAGVTSRVKSTALDRRRMA